MQRRTFVITSALSAFSIAAFGALHWNGKNFEGDNITTTDIPGPYYRHGSPMRSNLIPPGSTGQVLHLKGIIHFRVVPVLTSLNLNYQPTVNLIEAVTFR